MAYKLITSIFVVLILTSCGTEKYSGDFSYQVEDFSYTSQAGETLSKSDLDGQFWIANMIFTNCTSICPPMTANMARLQGLLDDAGIDAQLVSFSVDPTNDTPEILQEYIEERGGNFDNWHALTGYSDDDIKQFANQSFKAFVENPDNSDQVIHVSKFYLVSPEGNTIKSYDGEKAADMTKIVEDIQAMN
ncbi:SCO family protein [Gracilibacillus sp. S3-1-1]|uniref:SCO family protein n=1 Tax=Gracilibacillus pellucidus TaxID=3095368 RepID=A0ACC6M1P9_9BACI|nr:SCO family protein [Gracilibacillus sp. S3-1-1]MDX8044865.1 SCO family protein [Gracilibacillus sp. S3-1-1]